MRSDHLSKHFKTHQAKKGGLGSNAVIDGMDGDVSTGNMTGNDSEDMGEMTAIEDQDEMPITGDDNVEGHEDGDVKFDPVVM